MAQYKKLEKTLFAALLAVTAAVMGKALLVGLEIDEEYALSLGWRLVQGDRLFYTMWEPHQLAGLFTAPLLLFWRALTGTTTGALLFVRSVTLLLKAALGWWFYRVFRARTGRGTAFLAALLLFCYTPKWFLGPDYVSQQLHFSVAAFLCLYGYYAPGPGQYRRAWRVVVGAGCACMSYLAYPQSIVAVLPLFIGLWRLGAAGGEKRIGVFPRGVPVFTASCAAGGAVFLVYVLQGLGFDFGLLLSRAVLILHDPQYSFTAGERLRLLATQAATVLRFCLLPAVATVFLGVVLRKKVALNPEKAAWGFSALVAAWCAVQSLRHTDLDMRHFCLAAALAGGVTFWVHRRDTHRKTERTALFWLGWLPGWAAYLMILRSTLIALPTTFMYLLWPAVCGAAALALNRQDENEREFLPAAFLAAALLSVLVGRAFLLQTTGWHAQKMGEASLQKITTGPAKGIWADEKAADMQEGLYEALAPYEGGQLLQAIGEVHGLGFLMADGTLTVGQASVISGTDSDPRFIRYYEELPQKAPTVILYDYDEVREMTAFHRWIETQSAFAPVRRYDVNRGTAALEVLLPEQS